VSCAVWPTCTLGDAGLTVTVATGTIVTVIVDVPLFPSLVAVTVAVPPARAVTSPLALTRAIVVSLLLHVTVRPMSGLPLASFGVAVSCVVWPTCKLADVGLTVTDATGTKVTVTLDVPLCPSLVAVIVADQAPAALTRPLPLTVATDVLVLVHVITRPDSGLPLASVAVAVSCTVCPVVRLAEFGLTVTEATGTFVTVMLAVPLFPSLVAVIVAEPVPAPVARPVPPTVTAELLLAHVTVRPVSTLPMESVVVACSCVVAPTRMVAAVGATLTADTGASVTVTSAVSDTLPGLPVATTLYWPGFGPAL